MTRQMTGPDHRIVIGPTSLPVWPSGQKLRKWFDTGVAVTQFDDHAVYAKSLAATVLRRAGDPALGQSYMRDVGIGSAKVYDLDKWESPAADLVHARALAMFRMVGGGAPAVVDLSWASVYRSGDYCLPHSHPRTQISVLYMLDPGDDVGAEADAEGDGDTGGNAGANTGRFYFADPRMAPCCREEPGYMSTPCAPTMKPGMMMLFPGAAVHLVTPYRGERPRITLSWNLNQAAKAGSPLPEGVTRPG